MTQVRGSFSGPVRTGIFETTSIDNKRYVTRLEFVNQPLALASGTNANGSLCLLDIAAQIAKFSDTIIDLVVTAGSPAPYGADTFAVNIGVGTTAQTDAATPHTVATGDNIVGTAAYSATATSDAVKVATTTAVVIDESAGPFSVYLNVTQTSHAGPYAAVINGFIDLVREDLGVA